MKRLFAGFITAALLICCLTVSASARHGCRAADTVCGGFRMGRGPAACVNLERVRCHTCVDEDGDGMCDSYDPNRCPNGGVCGGGYVDADNNGVCDNYDPEYCPGDGTNCGDGYGGGNGYGCGSGSGYGGGHHGGGHGRHHG